MMKTHNEIVILWMCVFYFDNKVLKAFAHTQEVGQYDFYYNLSRQIVFTWHICEIFPGDFQYN